MVSENSPQIAGDSVPKTGDSVPIILVAKKYQPLISNHTRIR